MDLQEQSEDIISSYDNISDLFSKASTYFASIAAKLSSNDLLYSYSLYKQSIEGPCNIPRPSFFDLKGKQKWDAWKSLKDMPKEEAMQLYIEKLSELEPTWEGAKVNKIGWVYVSRLLPEEVIEDCDKTIFNYVQENNLEKLKQYSGSDLMSCDANGMTALHWACDRGYANIVEYLLNQKLDVNGQDADGQTPLHYASSCSHETIVKILLEFGAKKNLKDFDGTLPFDCAEEENIKALLM